MSHLDNAPIERRLIQFSRFAALLVAAVAALVLLGWVFDVAALKSIVPGWETMKANTALGFLLSGLTLALLPERKPIRPAWHATVRRSAAGAVAFLGAATLLEYLTGLDLGIDQWLFDDSSTSSGAVHAGRMAPNTAIGFLFMGAALLASEAQTRRGYLLAQWLALLAGLIGFVALLGYVYGVVTLQRIGSYSSMALHTAISFLVLSGGVLTAQPARGWMALLSSATVGGLMARRSVPAAILLPPLLGWLRTLGENAGWYGTEFGRALLVCSVVVVFTYLIGRNAALLNFVDLERKRAEKSLRKSQEQLRSMIEQAPISIALFDREMHYLVGSRRWKEEYGRGRNDLIGRSLYDIHPDMPQHWKEIHRRGLAGESLKNDEDHWTRDDGSQHWLHWAVQPWHDAQGAIGGVIISAEDITERKRAEQALRLSDERTRLIVENALDAVVTMDRDGLITGWSAQAESIFGWTRAQARGRVLAETIIPERYRIAHRDGLKRFLETSEARVLNTRIELFALHRDGHEFPVELAITPLRAGKDMAFSAFVRDITQRNRAEQALRESEERFRTLAESLPQLVWTCRSDGWCDYLSRQWLEFTGRTHEEQIGLGWAEQLHPDDRERVEREWASASAQGRYFDLEFRIRRHDGVYRWFKTRAVPLRNDAGEIVKWFGSNTDFEDLKQSEARLKQAYDDLRQTQQAVMQQERLRALSQMASGIAHDINNAISPIMLYTESLLDREPGLSGEARRYLETIQRAINDVAQTVTGMREFYRPRETQGTLVPLDVNRLMQQVVELTRARWSDMAQRQGIAIEVKIDLPSDLPAILGAEAELRDALTNLVFNALDAMPQGGTLTLGAEGAPERVVLKVCDTGMGMDEHTRQRCLEPFFTTKGERGTGLGLAMVYGTAQRHQADLDIQSALGQGTIIRLSFPAATAAMSPPQTAAIQAMPAALRILLVDDDSALIQSLSDILAMDGHSLTLTNGGQAGIDAFRSAHETGQSFNVVMTDLGMPQVDGRKVAAAVKALVPAMPVILLTGWGHRLLADQEIPPHVDRVLAKPPRIAELRRALAELTAVQTAVG